MASRGRAVQGGGVRRCGTRRRATPIGLGGTEGRRWIVDASLGVVLPRASTAAAVAVLVDGGSRLSRSARWSRTSTRVSTPDGGGRGGPSTGVGVPDGAILVGAATAQAAVGVYGRPSWQACTSLVAAIACLTPRSPGLPANGGLSALECVTVCCLPRRCPASG